ncbi:3-keto-5-aminohexanoate cleavage protein, partial [Paraburkholderia sp. EG286B]|uniref:3-keto-5-aminohexanoate cleavage protein n=1 Tax=Paraburkholderia sp. EG286B TaxID=3237011 RepID=UPI0034D1B1F7
TLGRNVVPMNTMAIALGLHVRVGIEDTLIGPDGKRASSVQQIEQMVRIARELNRDVASAQEARGIYQIGTQWKSVDETLDKLRMVPNRAPEQRGVPARKAA